MIKKWTKYISIQKRTIGERHKNYMMSAEIEREEKWLMIAGYNAYNVYVAFNSIKRVLKEARDEE